MNSSGMTEMTTKTLHRLRSHAALVAALLLTGMATQAAESAPDEAAPAAAATPSQAIVQSLSRFTSVPGPLRLTGIDAEQRLTLPLSTRLDVRSATLHLEVTSSMAMLVSMPDLEREIVMRDA